MNVRDFFPRFTRLFREFRPNDSSKIVYCVDTGEEDDFNVVIKAADFDESDNMIGDFVEMVVSKEWLVEYYKGK